MDRSNRPPGPKIKICDFEKTKNIQKDFGKGRRGLCDTEKRIIWINSRQPITPQVTQGIILHHEKAHLMLSDLKILWKPKIEERFCDLYALIKAPLKSLTAIEKLYRKDILSSDRIWFRIIKEAHDAPTHNSNEAASFWFHAILIKKYSEGNKSV